jgi:hypothetical protein
MDLLLYGCHSVVKSDDSINKPENMNHFEAIYGPGLISMGGLGAVDRMFQDLDLNGKHLLDNGFGPGRIAHCLAETMGLSVTCLEVHSCMT